MMIPSPKIQAYFDEPTNTVSYLVADPGTRYAAVVDPVLDYDHASGKASTESAQRILADIKEAGLTLQWVLETHAHADHLSAAPFFQKKTGAHVVIGEHIVDVQRIFSETFNLEDISCTG